MPTVQRTPPRKVTQVAANLRRQILNRQIKTGARLPTQRELSTKFNVAPNTAFAAMALLEGEGLVVRRQGSGSYVSERLPHTTTGTLHFARLRQVQGERARLSDMDFLEELSVQANVDGYMGVPHHLSHEEVAHPADILDRFGHARGVILRWHQLFGLAGQLHQRGIPTVIFTAPLNMTAPFSQLTNDPAADVAAAVDHLFSVGCRRIAYIGRTGWTIFLSGYMQGGRQRKIRPIKWFYGGKEPADNPFLKEAYAPAKP